MCCVVLCCKRSWYWTSITFILLSWTFKLCCHVLLFHCFVSTTQTVWNEFSVVGFNGKTSHFFDLFIFAVAAVWSDTTLSSAGCTVVLYYFSSPLFSLLLFFLTFHKIHSKTDSIIFKYWNSFCLRAFVTFISILLPELLSCKYPKAFTASLSMFVLFWSVLFENFSLKEIFCLSDGLHFFVRQSFAFVETNIDLLFTALDVIFLCYFYTDVYQKKKLIIFYPFSL